MRDCPSVVTSSSSEAISIAQGQTSGIRGPDKGGPQTGGATCAWQPSGGAGRGIPLEDSLVDYPEHRQVGLEVRLPEYIW